EEEQAAAGRTADLEHAVVRLHEHLAGQAERWWGGEDLARQREQAAAPPRAGELAAAFGDLVRRHRGQCAVGRGEWEVRRRRWEAGGGRWAGLVRSSPTRPGRRPWTARRSRAGAPARRGRRARRR